MTQYSTTQYSSFHLDIKGLDSTGEFSGYASVFDVVDSGNDMVVKGAFAESLRERNKSGDPFPILWQHDTKEPLGPYHEVREDEKGLFVRGKLLVNTVAKAKEAYSLLESKTVTGLSIGYRIISEKYDEFNDYNRLLGIDLKEISLVTFPMLDIARVHEVKSVEDVMCIRSLEMLLRDAAGLSRKQAKTVCSRFTEKTADQRDAAEVEPNVLAVLRSTNSTLWNARVK